MQTKRDQLQAHNFVVGRLRSALLRGDADALETPTRRFSVAAFAGAMIAVLLVAGCGVLGLLFPGASSAWQEPGTIVVEKESATRYLFIGGALRPVVNFASARLLVGADAEIVSVSRKSLRGVPHGLPIGIPGAPDALPEPAKLADAPWLVCSAQSADASGRRRPLVTLVLGKGLPVVPLGTGSAAPVRTPDGTVYVAWGDRRMRVADRAALVALGYAGVQPIPVGAAWVNALPQGPDLRPPEVADRGANGPALGGRPTLVGQVFVVETTSGDRDFYLALRDGMAPVPETLAALVLADPASSAAYPGARVRPIEVGADAVVAARRAGRSFDASGYPPAPPTPFATAELGSGSVCVRLAFKAGGELSVEVVASQLAPPTRGADGPDAVADPRAANRVVVAPGAGVLARAQLAPGVPGQALYLITDVGLKYPLASVEVAEKLGYAGVAPVEVPALLLALVPTGPALSPDRAGETYTRPSSTP
jgi:type VII secretion protein EccB